MGQYVVQVTGYDVGGAVARTFVFAMGAGLAFTDAAYAPGYFFSWNSPSQKVNVSKDGGVQLSADSGQLVIQNVPKDISSAGPLDALMDYAWFGRYAQVFWISDGTWATRALIAQGMLEQPVATLQVDTGYQSNLAFTVRDPRAVLSVPAQPVKYLGNNAAGAGVEGEADIKGKPKPILYGLVSNIPGVRVNQQKLIYQLADKAVTVLCARDGGAGLTAGVVRANVASLQANIPTPGTYDYCAVADGTYVRLGSSPAFTVTFDAAEGALSSDRTHAQVWKRMRMERCANLIGVIDGASVTALDVLDANEVGFWFADDANQIDLINAVLTSCSGYEIQALTGIWSIAKLVAPSGASVIDLCLVRSSPLAPMTVKNRAIVTLGRARPDFAPDGAPPYRVSVNWGQNYTVMAATDFAGVATQRLRDKFGQQWRTETATNLAIWNPTTLVGPWPNAPELTVDTGYQPGVDNLTCPHAATEATRLVTLYSALKAQYLVTFLSEVTDALLPGAVVTLTHPQGLSGGPLFLVLQSSLKLEDSQRKDALVLGFQT